MFYWSFPTKQNSILLLSAYDRLIRSLKSLFRRFLINPFVLTSLIIIDKDIGTTELVHISFAPTCVNALFMAKISLLSFSFTVLSFFLSPLCFNIIIKEGELAVSRYLDNLYIALDLD
ncbi:hypothetical protein SLOPH_2529 [Spraguea lophii 42_110]|uniref:Uncharacterized protein n=1 Tax=Spraguea lophii (strain 42_110) TaxID=1358809 RepID=S7W4Z0_SPRLO|nr:hypothetical protein SLOPH_2529 [Spraguea lophii 42_110]